MKNLKTTLAGCITAGVFAAASIISSGGAIVAKDLLIAAGVAVLGYLAKDAKESKEEPKAGG